MGTNRYKGIMFKLGINGQHFVPQRGVSLVIILLFLSAITGITIFAVQQSILGEGLARNQLDVAVARQSAEAALRDAERDLTNVTQTVLTNASCTRGRTDPPLLASFGETCPQGFCVYPEDRYLTSNWTTKTVAAGEPWWPTGRGGQWNDDESTKPDRTSASTKNCTFIGGVPLGTFTGTLALRGVAKQPEYLVEYFNRVSPVTKLPTSTYRITARGFGYTRRTQIVLQTIFAPLQEDN